MQDQATTTERVSVPRILADVLLFGATHKLPDPIKLHIYGDNASVDLGFASRTDLDAWHTALECTTPVREQPYKDRVLCNASSQVRPLGYRIDLDALTEPSAHTELPAETLTALDHIANPPAVQPAVSDERVEEILTHLNGFVDHEYEGGTELRDGVAVRVKTVVGTDFNLDKAINWALDQPEVSLCCGPDANGAADVTLIDDTVLFWDTEASAWAVEARS